MLGHRRGLLSLLALLGMLGHVGKGVAAPATTLGGSSGTNQASSWPCYTLHAAQIWQLNLPGGRRFDASGLTFLPNGHLITVSDRGPTLYRIQFLRGTNAANLIALPDIFTPAQLAPFATEKVGRYDCEGITCDPRGRIYLCEEANRWILRDDPAKGTVERLPIDWSPVQRYFSPTDRNASFEGVAVAGNRLFVANERSLGRLIVVNLRTMKVVDSFVVRPAHPDPVWGVQNLLEEAAGVLVGKKLSNNTWDVHYSDLCWYQGALYVLLRESQCILKVNPKTHHVLAEYGYGAVARRRQVAYRWPYPTGLMEGLAVDRNSFWLVTDNNGAARRVNPADHRPTLCRCPRPDR